MYPKVVPHPHLPRHSTCRAPATLPRDCIVYEEPCSNKLHKLYPPCHVRIACVRTQLLRNHLTSLRYKVTSMVVWRVLSTVIYYI